MSFISSEILVVVIAVTALLTVLAFFLGRKKGGDEGDKTVTRILKPPAPSDTGKSSSPVPIDISGQKPKRRDSMTDVPKGISIYYYHPQKRNRVCACCECENSSTAVLCEVCGYKL